MVIWAPELEFETSLSCLSEFKANLGYTIRPCLEERGGKGEREYKIPGEMAQRLRTLAILSEDRVQACMVAYNHL